jgi:MoaD family protein
MIRVRLFAALRELADAAEVEVGGRNVDDVARALGERYGTRFASIVDVSSFVVNGERADRGTPIAEDDEVAILPPVSGGAGSPRRSFRSAASTHQEQDDEGERRVQQQHRPDVPSARTRGYRLGGCAENRPLPYSPPCGSTASCWS